MRYPGRHFDSRFGAYDDWNRRREDERDRSQMLFEEIAVSAAGMAPGGMPGDLLVLLDLGTRIDAARPDSRPGGVTRSLRRLAQALTLRLARRPMIAVPAAEGLAEDGLG